jgi:hypothetical protein
MGPSPYLGEWYQDKPDWSSADLVTLTVGEQRTLDAVLDRVASVSGTVTDAAGVAVQGAMVRVESGGTTRYQQTGADGTYAFTGLRPGTYRLNVEPSDPAFAPGPDVSLTLASGQQLTGVDVVLHRYATITGVVRGSGGVVLPNTYVELTTPDGQHPSTLTDRDGRYRFTGLRPGEHSLTVTPPADSWYLPTSASVHVGWDDTLTVDLTPPLSGRISGKVTSNRDRTAGNVTVEVIDPATRNVVATAQVQANNTYLVTGIVPGVYVVHFAPAPGNPHVAEYYDNARSFEKADPVKVRPSRVTTKVNAELRKLNKQPSAA